MIGVLTATVIASVATATSLQDFYVCSIRLTSQTDANLIQYVGTDSLRMTFLREKKAEQTLWMAGGHANLAVHRAADNAFPIAVSDHGNRMDARWKIHEANADGVFRWYSADRTAANFTVVVSNASFHPAPYTMSGTCLAEPSPFQPKSSGSPQ